MSERRDEVRRRVCFAGLIETAAFLPTLPCMVRDVSLTGARLKIDAAAILPDRVVLAVPLRGEQRRARVVWRQGEMAGLRFEVEQSRTAVSADARAAQHLRAAGGSRGDGTLH